MKKRTVAVAFLVLVAVLVAATLAVLRTRWAGERLCQLASERLEAATGLEVTFGACRIDPLGLDVEAAQVRLERGGAPVFSADGLSARLALVQALGRQLHLEAVRLVRPRLALDLAGGGGGGTCPPPFLSRFEIRQLEVDDGAVELGLPGGRHLSVGRIDVRARPPARTLEALARPARRARVEIAAGPVRLDAGGRSWFAAHADADLEVALDLSSARIAGAHAEVEGARLSVDGHVSDLCAPRVDLAARAEGPIPALLALAGYHPDAAGTAAVEARVKGPLRAPEVTVRVRTREARIDHFVAGDGEAQVRLDAGALRVERVEVAAQGGKVVARGTVRLARGVPVDAEVDATGVDLAEVLERLGVPGAWLTVRLDGKGRIQGTLAPPQLSGSFEGDAHDLKALTRSFHEGAGDRGVLAFAAGRVATGVRIDREGIAFPDARVTVGRGTLRCDALAHFRVERGFSAQCRGDVDLTALGRVAAIPWAGRASVEATMAAAPYGNPRIVGRARVEGFRFLDLDLGELASDFTYDRFLLHLDGAQGVKGAARYRGEGLVDLSRTPALVVSSRVEARGRIRDLLDAVRDFLPRTRGLRDVVDGEVELAATAHGPADALDSDFDARLGTGTLLGRRFESGRATGAILGAVTVRLDRGELRRGTGIARLQGTWGADPPFPWRLDASFAGVPLAELDLAGRWEGSASGTAALDGSYEHPRVRFAANGDAVTVQGVRVGTVQAGGTLQERHLVVTGGADGIDFQGDVELAGGLPFRARAELALDDAARLLPDGAPSGFRAKVRGHVTAEGALEELARTRGALRLDVLQASYADLRLEAAAPVSLTIDSGRLELAPVTLRGASTELTVSGSGTSAGALDLAASGAIDLQLLGAAIPALRRPHGQLSLEAHVGGTVAEPVLVGAGRIGDAGFQVRGATAAVEGLRGPVAFSQNRILFDGLAGDLNGGALRLKGEVELARLLPSRISVQAELGDVPVALVPQLPVTLRGRIEAAGTPDAALVTGRVHVVRARYTSDVDLEGSLVGRRRPPAPPRPYDKAGEWLGFDLQVAVDGDARVDNDLVRGAVSGDLTLTGTLAAPGLVGTLAMGEGSRLMFRGNEFNLTHAVLEFTDRHKIEVALDVHGESQVRDYDVLMHVFGSMASPEVTLTSVPSLPQQDIVTLLSLGFTRRDAAAGTGVEGVATAAAAQALFSASGLDEQVRRLLPRSGPIRDLSMRITSAYSEESGQVEPRAEFESWLLRDRLRLRFQAPLGGARGRKAQAELRLGPHSALQYEWDNDNPDVSTGDHGLDLKLRWEWTDDR